MKPITEETVSGLLRGYEEREQKGPGDAPSLTARILPFRTRDDGFISSVRAEAAVSLDAVRKDRERARTVRGFFFYSTKG